MSKIVVVTGYSGSGKTVTAAKLAKSCHHCGTGPVILLSPDLQTPVMPLLLPKQSQDVQSLGSALNRTDVTEEDVLRAMVTPRKLKNLGILGYMRGENRHTYPNPTEDKIDQLLLILSKIAELIVVDASTQRDDEITQYCIARADHILQLITPDLKCMTYHMSRGKNFYGSKEITVLNHVVQNMFPAQQEILRYFGTCHHELPYSRDVTYQVLSGLVLEQSADKKYEAAISGVLQAVMR